ncbi:hypothetical protein K8354_15245 [Polaribacter litorisediminis]|uniref:hypothetical protein n=1 Tax=Polaribacter litorisediminis TaxID=1908341 RepID=UPI001CBF945B|nr:hypothetical protein [Polaribacter litorisediminis]UAM97640.1 hypothetical protein K8354_15245 [Polaribacter litorisediminis]
MKLIIYPKEQKTSESIQNLMEFYYSLKMHHLASDLLNKGLSPEQISNAVSMAIKIAQSSGIGTQKHFMPVYSSIDQQIIKDCKLSAIGYGLVLMNANPNLAVVGDFQVSLLKKFMMIED